MDANDEMEMLKREYAKALPDKTRPIAECAAGAIAALKTGQQPNWPQLEKLTHKLAGSAGTYGFQPLTAICREMEDLISEGRIQVMPPQMAATTLEDWARRFAFEAQAACGQKAAA